MRVVQALRDRDFQAAAPTSRKWAEMMDRILRQTSFSTLEYKPTW